MEIVQDILVAGQSNQQGISVQVMVEGFFPVLSLWARLGPQHFRKGAVSCPEELKWDLPEKKKVITKINSRMGRINYFWDNPCAMMNLNNRWGDSSHTSNCHRKKYWSPSTHQKRAFSKLSRTGFMLAILWTTMFSRIPRERIRTNLQISSHIAAQYLVPRSSIRSNQRGHCDRLATQITEQKTSRKSSKSSTLTNQIQ